MNKSVIVLFMGGCVGMGLCSAMDCEKSLTPVKDTPESLSYYDYLVKLRDDYRTQSIDLESATVGVEWFLNFNPPIEVTQEERYKPTFAALDLVDVLNKTMVTPDTQAVSIDGSALSSSIYSPYCRYLTKRLIKVSGGIAAGGVGYADRVLKQLALSVEQEPLEDLGNSFSKVTLDKNGQVSAMEALENGLEGVSIVWYAQSDASCSKDQAKRLTQQFLREIRRLKGRSVVPATFQATADGGMTGVFVKHFNAHLANNFSLACREANIYLSNFMLKELGGLGKPIASPTKLLLHSLEVAATVSQPIVPCDGLDHDSEDSLSGSSDTDLDYREPGEVGKK